jgi:TRAP transporter 4TM/12TM fusion protein
MDRVLRRVLYAVAIVGTLYHLYLVVHPYTPLARLRISVLDLTQVQRATHVLFICVLGYLTSAVRPTRRSLMGSIPIALLSGIVLWQFLQLDLPLPLRALAVPIWACTILSPMFPATQRWCSLAAVVLSVLPFVYLVGDFEQLIYRAMTPEPWDLLMAFSEVLLVLGVIFRLSGPIMPIFVLVFLLYNVYGYVLPDMWSNPGFDLDMLLGKLYSETEAGIFGTITGVSVKYLVYFTILGAIISALDFGKVIANIALLFVGRSPASPGRTSSVMAVLMGMFSGSGAADTQFVATLTKPLYERVGYDKLVAAGILATVGSIAYITPPVLGSISFLMVELLAIPYSWIIVMSLGPMVLYLFGIVVYNELYVRREKLPPMTVAVEHDFSYFKRHAYVFAPIAFIIVLIYRGYSINVTVAAATGLFVLFAYVDRTLRPPVKKLLDGLAEGILSLLPIASAVIAANMIMTMMVMSGLASKFSLALMTASGSSLLVATIFTAFFSLVLGMGVPPVATYVLTSALTAPAIQQLAQANGIPAGAALLATHMFLFYYAVLAEVTPPVALSAYAAASVMGTDPIQTGVFASRAALPKYLIGITFILSFSGAGLLILPALQNLSLGQAVVQIGIRYVVSSLGIFCLNVAVLGWLGKNLSVVERIVVGVTATLLFYPSSATDVAGSLLLVLFFAKKWIERRREAAKRAFAG